MERKKREQYIQIRLSNEEKELLEKKCLLSKCSSKSQLIRRLLIDGAVIRLDEEKLNKIYRCVASAASNIRAINIASQYCAEDNLNLENILHLKYRNQGVLSEKLNHIKTEIDDLELKIKTARTVQKLKPVSDQSRSFSGRKKDKFDEEHGSELKAFSKAVRHLRVLYCGQSQCGA